MRKQLAAVSLVSLFCVAPLANAHQAGEVIIRAGIASVQPNDSSSKLKASTGRLPGTKATVDDDTQLGVSGTYMITDKVGVELLAATPFKHDIGLKGVDAALGAAGGTFDGKFGTTKQLPPTVTLQYYPMDAKSPFQPYVGVGLNYTHFFSKSLTNRQKANGFSKLDLDDSFGAAGQLGMDYMLTDRLMFNAAVWYIDIKTEATVRHNALGKLKVDVDVDPWVYMVGIGYKF